MALRQVVTKIVGHVDTVWDTNQVYTRTILKSKYVTIHGVNRWNSLTVNLTISAMLPRNSTRKVTIYYLINYFQVGTTVASAHEID